MVRVKIRVGVKNRVSILARDFFTFYVVTHVRGENVRENVVHPQRRYRTRFIDVTDSLYFLYSNIYLLYTYVRHLAYTYATWLRSFQTFLKVHTRTHRYCSFTHMA